MKEQKPSELSLKALEAEVLAEGLEWTRQRLQQPLPAQAQAAGAWQTRPLSRTRVAP